MVVLFALLAVSIHLWSSGETSGSLALLVEAFTVGRSDRFILAKTLNPRAENGRTVSGQCVRGLRMRA